MDCEALLLLLWVPKDSILVFTVIRCIGIQGYLTCVVLRVDAHGRETGIADEILAAGFACFCQVRPFAKFFGYDLLVLPSEHVTNVAASTPPRGMRALALA